MPKSSALAMWSLWLAAALVNVAATDVQTTTITSDPNTDPPPPGRLAKLLERDRESPRAAHRTLDRTASELAWKNWLQSPENKDPGVPPRRITPKSVFITPHNCPEGKRLNGEECISVQQVGKEVHEQYILEQLNHMTDPGGIIYDYDDIPSGPSIDNAEGPLQLNLPLGSLALAASQNVPSRVPAHFDKNDDEKEPDNAELEAELLKLKQGLNKLAIIKENQMPIAHAFGEYSKIKSDKPKRNNAQDAEPVEEQGQKEVIFGNVSEDKFQYVTKNQTKNDSPVIVTSDELNSSLTENQTTEAILEDFDTETERTGTKIPTTTSEPTTDTDPTEAVTENVITTTTAAHNLEDNEKPTKLHPEIDYSDIGEAVKLISRYAEVSTDEMFSDEHKKTSVEEGPLGTRTKQQHRKRPKPLETDSGTMDSFPGLYPPPPPPPPASSVYADQVPARIIYKAPPAYFQYQQHYPAPPADYPFRHVQQYWARPELLVGPYGHGNPRRHHHSYSARHPPAPAPRDLYRLLGLRHWFNGDGSAER